MIKGLDSATPPNASQVAAARAAGYKVWSGYIQTQPNMGLYRPWSQAEFNVAAGTGSPPIAYASGWDNPVACKNLAATWGVRLCLDVEGGIRGDGPWVQAWLNSSGAGLYGNAPVHTNRVAAFHVLAAYGLDPNATWASRIPKPSTPCAWQWQGTHSQFGVGVDSTWLDDWFSGTYGPSPGHLGEDMIFGFRHTSNGAEYIVDGSGIRPLTAAMAAALDAAAKAGGSVGLVMVDADAALDQWQAQSSSDTQAILAAIKAIPVGQGSTVDLTPVLAAIADLKAHPTVASDPVVVDIVTKIEKALQGA